MNHSSILQVYSDFPTDLFRAGFCENKLESHDHFQNLLPIQQNFMHTGLLFLIKIKTQKIPGILIIVIQIRKKLPLPALVISVSPP